MPLSLFPAIAPMQGSATSPRRCVCAFELARDRAFPLSGARLIPTRAGASVDVADAHGATALSIAAFLGHVAIAQALVGAGARVAQPHADDDSTDASPLGERDLPLETSGRRFECKGLGW
eukprot:6208819-Pleurochrysis_carterae.AAC.1